MAHHGNTLISSLCYADAPAAILWLEKAFGFTPHLVVPEESGKVRHAQLMTADGKSMFMLYSQRHDHPQHPSAPPTQLGGSSQSLYLVVDDVAAHYERALAAGAKIILPPTAQDYGGSCYTCVDPEGHIWNFGSYNPWA
jgi:uncharacterized glyoxalase superfamily protein PhnB